MIRLMSWIGSIFKPVPTRRYVPEQDPDVMRLRRQRLESKRQLNQFQRQQHRIQVDSLRDRVTVPDVRERSE